MTDENDSDPALRGKGSAEAFLKALSDLGSLGSRLREAAPPPTPFGYGPITSLDLLATGAEAKAASILDRLRSGELTAYGRPTAPVGIWRAAIPTADWPRLWICWSTGHAQHLTANSTMTGVAWLDLELPTKCLVTPPAQGAEFDALMLTLTDAVAVARRWRESWLIPEDYPWLEEEYWKANPDLRPDAAETKTALVAAIKSGELETFLKQSEEWDCVRASTWNASKDRVDLNNGRVNVGEVLSAPKQGIGLFGAGGQWELVFLPLWTVREWCERQWGAEMPDAVPEASHCRTSDDNHSQNQKCWERNDSAAACLNVECSKESKIKPPVSRTKIQEWYTKLVSETTQEGKRLSCGKVWEFAKAAFPNNKVSREVVRNLIKAITPDWSERGRPKKNRG